MAQYLPKCSSSWFDILKANNGCKSEQPGSDRNVFIQVLIIGIYQACVEGMHPRQPPDLRLHKLKNYHLM